MEMKMKTRVIDTVPVTTDGDLILPGAVKAHLRRLLAQQPGAVAFSAVEEAGALVLVPVREEECPAYVPTPEEIAEVVAYFHEQMQARVGEPPSLDEEFIGGLTYREYFALSEEEEKALWDAAFADEAMEIDDFTEVEVAPDARVSA